MTADYLGEKALKNILSAREMFLNAVKKNACNFSIECPCQFIFLELHQIMSLILHLDIGYWSKYIF